MNNYYKEYFSETKPGYPSESTETFVGMFAGVFIIGNNFCYFNIINFNLQIV